MGSMQQIMQMIPGLSGKLKGADLEIDETKVAHMKAIIRSMTPAERRDPDSIKSSNKKRIAAGSGTTIQEVNSLLKQFYQTQEMMNRMAGMGRRGFGKLPF